MRELQETVTDEVEQHWRKEGYHDQSHWKNVAANTTQRQSEQYYPRLPS